MGTFTVRDLRERTSDLIRGAVEGKLSMVTRHGKPVFVAVPFDEALLRSGVHVVMTVKLFDEEGACRIQMRCDLRGRPQARTGKTAAMGLRQTRLSILRWSIARCC
jgi:prevent-host-death family protein